MNQETKPSESMPADPLIGLTLGNYRILRPLGQGGMASVYVAYQDSMQREVALKLIRRDLTNDPTFFSRFEREARTIAALEHVHILPAIEFGKDEGYVYLVTRLMDTSLASYVTHNHPLPLGEIARLFSQIADALDYAHEHGVIHRDLKPANVLLDKQRNCFLADFGIAYLADATSALTADGRIVGTPNYMAPELISGGAASPSSDLYSLGIMLYEMVSARVPFVGETPFVTMNMHLYTPPPIPSSFRSDLPKNVEAVVLKAIHKSPEGRYPSARALADALAYAVQGMSPAAVAKASAPAMPVAAPTRAGVETGSAAQPFVADENEKTFVGDVPAEASLNTKTEAIAKPIVSTAPTTTVSARRKLPVVPLAIAGVVAILLIVGAIVFFTSKSQPDSKAAAAFNKVGLEALQKLDYTNAMDEFNKAINADPNYAAAYFNLGVAYEEQNKLPDAVKNYQLALDKDSRLLNARYRLAELLLDDNKITEGFNVVDQGVRVLQEGGDLGLSDSARKLISFELFTTRGRAYYMRGTKNNASGDYALAVRDLKEAEAYKESVQYPAPVFYYLAKVYTAQGDKANAQQAWYDMLANYDQNNARQRDWATEAGSAVSQ